VNRFWCIVFLLVPILGVATFIVAPYYNMWFPRDVSTHGVTIDNLFMFILWLTGILFIATEWALVQFTWKYDADRNPNPVKFSHGEHTLEVVWTIVPAVILLFIAIYQMDAWAASKMRKPNIRPTAEISARQFNWDVRYPGPDKELHTLDDIVRYDGNIHLPMGEDVLLVIKSQDVLHSFFLPNLRLKQDIIPGMEQAMWFHAKDTGKFDVVCAELCGWGHYKMKARLTLQTRSEFDKWLAETYKAEQAMKVATVDQ